MKISRNVSSDRPNTNSNLLISVNESTRKVTLTITDKEFKIKSIMMNWEEFLDMVVAAWPENVAYQFKDKNED